MIGIKKEKYYQNMQKCQRNYDYENGKKYIHN